MADPANVFLFLCTPTRIFDFRVKRRKAADWKSIQDVRTTYPSADPVKVNSGRTVMIFNVCGNDFRLITAVHYDKQRVFTLEFLTHAEYDKNNWKKNR